MLAKLLLLTGLLTLTCSQGQVLNQPQIGSAPTLAQKVSFLAYTARYGKSYSST